MSTTNSLQDIIPETSLNATSDTLNHHSSQSDSLSQSDSFSLQQQNQWRQEHDQQRLHEENRKLREYRRKQIQLQEEAAAGNRDKVNQEGQNGASTTTASGEETLIYGTSIQTKRFEKHFREFLTSFQAWDEDETSDGAQNATLQNPTDTLDENDSQSTYQQELHRLHFRYDGGPESSLYNLSFVPTLNIKGKHLNDYSPSLYKQIISFPQELIPSMDMQATQYYRELYPTTRIQRIQTRICELTRTTMLRDLGPDNVNQLVSVRGMVTRVSEVIPDLKAGVFRCARCREETRVPIQRGFIEEPRGCSHCGSSSGLQMIHNRSVFSDKQLIKLQETPESIPEGETPHTVTLSSFDSLVDIVKPGDRIDVTGIFRAVSSRVNNRQTKMRNLFRTYIDVVHFRKAGMRISTNNENFYDTGATTLASATDNPYDDPYAPTVTTETEEPGSVPADSDTGEYSISPEDQEKIIHLSRDPHIYEKLVASIAPGIYEMEDVKKGVLCQLFGGTNKTLKNGKIRGEMHVLLVGDPGVSKSQILIHVNKIAPRGIYTSGKGSSAVGLTAYITKDLDTGEYVLESGALVLSDLGVCCIDEFDKMADQTRSILHEVMEQQTVSVAKAGIICSLNARTSILAAANPVDSRYNPKLTIVQNIRLMPTLLSRFDLIYILRDISDEQRDKRLAEHLIAMYHEEGTNEHSPIDMKLLTKYISYAKRTIRPTITDAASEKLKNGYVHLRQIGSDKSKISATTRQLESLIRLSESLAKMRLSQRVEERDVDEALRLIQAAFRENLYNGDVAQGEVVGATAQAAEEAASEETDDLHRDVDFDDFESDL